MQEGRGIGLMAKLQAYELQDQGRDTVQANEDLGFEADQRGFQLPARLLRELGLTAVRLLSNNPEKVAAPRHCRWPRIVSIKLSHARVFHESYRLK